MSKHRLPQHFYRGAFGYREGDFPITESVARSTLALPFSGVMTEEQVECVCSTLEEIVEVVKEYRRWGEKRGRDKGEGDMNAEDLRKLIAQGEGPRLEFKRSLAALRDGVCTIAAFANACPEPCPE